MKALLMWLTGRLPGRIYSDRATPFLERYLVGRLLGITVYIHRFVASDPDRGLHDHPWGWAFSLVLRGRYEELTRQGTRPVGWFNFLRGDSFHRVVLPRQAYYPTDADGYWTGIREYSEQECWTLFIHGPNVKRWGFLRPIEQGNGAQYFHPHRDRDGEGAESADWAATTPRGRDLPRKP